MAQDQEAVNIVVDMWKRRIFRVAETHERGDGRDGRLAAAGLFSVSKGKEIMLEEVCAKAPRLIVNLVPNNKLQKGYDEDTKTLPYHGNWEPSLLEKEVYFYWSMGLKQDHTFDFMSTAGSRKDRECRKIQRAALKDEQKNALATSLRSPPALGRLHFHTEQAMGSFNLRDALCQRSG